MSDFKLAYASSAALTITLASLASDATNMIAGRQSTLVDNTTNLYLDYLLSGKITTGTSPTTARQIEVWVWAWQSETGPMYPDTFGATDANTNVTTRDMLFQFARRAAVLGTTATSNQAYYFGPVSVRSVFGGTVPSKWGVWVVHNTAVNLHATGGNHVITAMPVYTTGS